MSHQLEDLGSFLWGVVGALLSRLALALRAIDRQLGFQQCGVGMGMIRLGEQAHHGHRVLERTGSGSKISAHKEDRDRLHQIPDEPFTLIQS